MKMKPTGFSLKKRDETDLEKMKNYHLIKSFDTYVLFLHNTELILLDSIKLKLYTVKTKWNLLEDPKFKDLINIYEFFHFN